MAKIVIIVVLICLVAIFLYLTLRIEKKKKLCTEKINGCVSSFKTGGNDHITNYYPVCEYTVSGTKYKACGCCSSNPGLKRGEIVSVMYEPGNPKRSYILGYDDKRFKIREIIYILLGLVFFVGMISLLFI